MGGRRQPCSRTRRAHVVTRHEDLARPLGEETERAQRHGMHKAPAQAPAVVPMPIAAK